MFQNSIFSFIFPVFYVINVLGICLQGVILGGIIYINVDFGYLFVAENSSNDSWGRLIVSL